MFSGKGGGSEGSSGWLWLVGSGWFWLVLDGCGGLAGWLALIGWLVSFGWLVLVGPGWMTLPLATEMLRATAAVTAMMMAVPTAMLTPNRPPHMMMVVLF